MPEFDHDLIAALAEGRLDPSEAAAAERVIAADGEATAALTQHRRALAAMRAASPATLTDGERNRVQMAVAEAIGLDRAPAPPASGRRAPWGAIGVAAVTLAALVAVVPIAGLLTSDQPDSSAVSLGIAEVDRSSARTAEDAGAEPMAGVDSTVQATDGMSTTPANGDFEGAPAAPDADVEEALTSLADDPAGGKERATAPTAETACAAEASDQIDASPDALEFIEMTIGDRQVLVFFTIVDGALDGAAAYSPADCELLGTLP
ncbi:MAG: hypothetical protein WEE36_06205 [Acidimicrobiia bacterium]